MHKIFALGFIALIAASGAFAGPLSPQNVSDIASMQVRPDGQYDVICTDGSRETVGPVDVQIGNLCPNRSATSPNTGIISVQKRADGKFNVICKDGSMVVASADDIMGGKVCAQTVGTPVDVIWVVGGMVEQMQNFNAGVTQFMTDFLQKSLSWRMAVVGSNVIEDPYLGMPTTFDNTSPSPLPTLINGIMNALNGQDNEQIFDPLVSNLTKYSSTFLRPGAKLVIVLTNDAHDASPINTKAAQVLNFLANLKGSNAQNVIVYGIFGATDLKCAPSQIDEDWNYTGSEFDALIQATGGQTYSLCDNSLGSSLKQISADIYRRLSVP